MQRAALEFVEKVDALTSADAVMDQFGAALRMRGIEYYVFGFVAFPTETFADVTLASRLPAGLADAYHERDLVHHDPALRHAQRTALPFRWLKEAPYDPDAEPRAQEVVNFMRDFGLVDGMVFPFTTIASRLGQVWLGGPPLDLPKRELPPLHMMAFYAFDRVLQIKGVETQAIITLTPREREALVLNADGKTADEIGEALNVSERTVRAYHEQARRKLGAGNLSQAVAMAMRQRMI
ncbi:LuxR family transcriptional regulator [Bradyrhizobium sp. USDA 313]|uniref:helix-turn-helix transcriptional regulator n=1 Tax=Bradyrhizobium sp. USDA 313 TaxID=3156307 RepID=UPI003517E359